jgi:hypothetical protein
MGVRAYSEGYNFYELLKDIPCVDAGAIFYWDKNDDRLGSIAEGCLKLCWTPDGSCYSSKTTLGVCGDTIVFHASARNDSNWFKLVQACEDEEDEAIQELTIEDIEAMLGHKVKIVSKQN